MIRVNSFLWFLLLVVVSCNNSGSGGPIMTLDMQFDTTCVVVNGGETIISIRNQFIVSDSTDIIRNTVFRNDHSGSFLLTNQTDSIFNKEHRLLHIIERTCSDFKDTVFIFGGQHVMCKIPTSPSSWTDNVTTTFHYSETGEFIKSESRNFDGQLIRSAVFDYHENGSLLSIIEYSGNNDYPSVRKMYDNAGRLIEEITNIGRKEYEYDEHDKCIVRRFNGITEEYRYDNNGNILKSITYNESGRIEYTVDYNYVVSKGRNVLSSKKQQMYSKGEINPDCYVVNEYQYDSMGRVVLEKELFKMSDDNLLRDRVFFYTYNDLSRSIVKTTNNNNKERPQDELFEYYSIALSKPRKSKCQ